MNIKDLIGETTQYDKKTALEIKKPKSWCKSVSAFANTYGGKLIFGIADNNEIVGLQDPESDAEKISEIIKNPSYDSRISNYKVEDFAFSKLRERYKKWTGNSFDEKDLISFGLANEQGYLTNAGALIADESPVMCSRLFCTRWNGLNKSGGVIDAFDDAEYSGSVISLIDNGEAFIKRNAKKMWRKTANSREEILYWQIYLIDWVIWNEKEVVLEK